MMFMMIFAYTMIHLVDEGLGEARAYDNRKLPEQDCHLAHNTNLMRGKKTAHTTPVR